MAGNLGKNMNFDGDGTATPMGVCTPMCPAACMAISGALCKCKNDAPKNKGSGYNTIYLNQVHSQRAPDV